VLIQLISSAGVSAALCGLILWITKSWISERLHQAIKNEYDQKLEAHKAELKAQSDVELEKLRSQLNISAIEHQISFSGLYSKRADIIREIHNLLTEVYWKMEDVFIFLQRTNEPNEKEKIDSAQKAIMVFIIFFEKHRIFLPENLCKILEGLVSGDIRRHLMHYSIYPSWDRDPPSPIREKKYDVLEKGYDFLKNEFSKARQQLENEFRSLLEGRKLSVSTVVPSIGLNLDGHAAS
jgi:hypothetical protein